MIILVRMSSNLSSNISTSKNEQNLREIYMYYIKYKSEVIWTSENVCITYKNNNIIRLNTNQQTNSKNTTKKRRQIVKPIIN